jgi:hypothetical protein
MAVVVIHKRLKPGPRRPALAGLVGDGLPERLRSTSIALLGVIAAVGLGLVGFALQLGFPLVAGMPLPEAPARPHVVSKRDAGEERPAKKAAAARPTTEDPSTASAEADPLPAGGRGPSPTPVAPRQAGEGAVLVTAPAQSRPRREQPVDRPAATPSPAPAAPAVAPPVVEPTAAASEVPEPAPETTPEATPPSHPGNGNAYGKGQGNGGSPPGQAAKGSGPSEAGE